MCVLRDAQLVVESGHNSNYSLATPAGNGSGSRSIPVGGPGRTLVPVTFLRRQAVSASNIASGWSFGRADEVN